MSLPDPPRAPPNDGADVTEEMIHAVVHAFYARVLDDPALSPIFNRVIHGEAWPVHLAKMCDFWSSVMLASGRYRGAPMPAHIRIGALGPAHFTRWLELFRRTVDELCPPDAAQAFVSRAEMIAQSLQLGIAASRGELPPVRSGPATPA
jgi:hemoglobin